MGLSDRRYERQLAARTPPRRVRTERFPGRPRMDIALVLEQLNDAKQLVQSAMEELKPKA